MHACVCGSESGYQVRFSCRRVVVIGATNRPERMDRSLRRPGRFEKELEVGVPTPKARVAMLEQNMLPLSNNVSKEAIKSIAETLHGFVAADIYGLAQAAAMRVMTRYVPPSALQLGTLT